ncbi:hypothetical protein ACQ5SO_09410 [Rhodovulum sp. DZ06]|uniref:hypothetical protein n=1 Tax=Rhodovulum sp. DZ06 TaxID=3425126 RepID=UPI003D34B4D9
MPEFARLSPAAPGAPAVAGGMMHARGSSAPAPRRAARRGLREGFDPARFRRLRPSDAASEVAAPLRGALRRAALALALALVPGVANAASMPADPLRVDIDARTTGADSAVSLALGAGTWTISLAEGGAFTAWNAWNGAVEGCDAGGAGCSKGWLTEFAYGSAGLGTVRVGSGRYADAGLAAAEFEPLVFTLLSAETVSFWNDDWLKSDNLGGLSLEVEVAMLRLEEDRTREVAVIPAPAALPLLATGAAALAALAARRRAAAA